jgi:ParB family protein of integrating conjugative element (PFGI_1 class)
MSKYPKRDLAEAMLQPGRQPATVPAGKVLPMGEMPMILTLDQLGPNPDNPRTTRNPRYDEIKASIHARGLDSVPKVTRDPDSDNDVSIFSDGGNTRYAILSELWQETGDERFYRINVVFKPWPGRLKCLIGHLAENEVRGDLTFIEKALGVRRARELYEEEHGKLSVRKLAQLLTDDGMPVGASSISRMMNTVDYLWPSIPVLLEAGMGRPQINALLALRQGALELWQEYENKENNAHSFDDVFSACCLKFDAPELWQPDAFRDELIGDCLSLFPHPELNYDRWLLAFEPRKRAQDVDTLIDVLPANTSSHSIVDASPQIVFDRQTNELRPVVTEEQPDLYGGNPVYSGDQPQEESRHKSVATGNTFDSPVKTSKPVTDKPSSHEDENTEPFPQTADVLQTTDNEITIGEMVSQDTDIEHLQSQAFRLAWAIADSRGYGDHIIPARENVKAPGFRTTDATPVPVALLLMSLTGEDIQSTSVNLNSIQGALFISLFTGGPDTDELPDLDQENAHRLVELLLVMRRLREFQRDAVPDDEEGAL